MRQNTRTRRSLIVGMGAAVATSVAGTRSASAQTPAAVFRPARHQEDSWLDSVPSTHRIFIDSASATGAGAAVLYANNLYTANKAAYSINERDLAIVICLRHFATIFGYTDSIWAKYGARFSTIAQFSDPNTMQPPKTNLYNATTYGAALPNLGNTLEAQRARGTRFAICDMATHFIAGQLAAGGLGTEDAIYKELVANTIPNSRMVSAGVVAVTRSQEYGYSLLYAG